MRRLLLATAIAGLIATAVPLAARAESVTETELLAAAKDLSQQYDANYNAKDAAGMARLYVEDGLLVTPLGSVVKGREALKPFYQSRFETGATGHVTTISEAHVQGDGGFGIGQFQVTQPTPDGGKREIKGNLGVVYQHGSDGWHLRMVMASIPAPLPK
jgi:uncharacterized protein (TIGR02246 family)